MTLLCTNHHVVTQLLRNNKFSLHLRIIHVVPFTRVGNRAGLFSII